MNQKSYFKNKINSFKDEFLQYTKKKRQSKADIKVGYVPKPYACFKSVW